MTKQVIEKATRAFPSYSTELHAILGEPALLASEDRNAYEAALAGVGLSIRPRDAVDWLLTKTFVDLTWEMNRLMKAKAAMIDLTEKESLRCILESVFEAESLQGKDRLLEAELRADDWYTKPAIRKEIIELLSRYRLNEQAITAQAVALRLTELNKLDSMIASAEIRRSAALRDLRSYRDNFAMRRYEQDIEVVEGDIDEFRLELPRRRPAAREPETIDELPNVSEAER